jgi:hypothetical protein
MGVGYCSNINQHKFLSQELHNGKTQPGWQLAQQNLKNKCVGKNSKKREEHQSKEQKKGEKASNRKIKKREEERRNFEHKAGSVKPPT